MLNTNLYLSNAEDATKLIKENKFKFFSKTEIFFVAKRAVFVLVTKFSALENVGC